MNPPDQPCQATPAGDLRQQIMDSRVPKNEREWWASREIEKLERKLADWSVLKGWGGTPEIVHKFVKGQQHRIHYCQNLEAELTALAAERDRLRAEVERLKVEDTDWELAFQAATQLIADSEAELAAANKRIADCEFLLEHRYKIIQQQEPRCNEAIARAEKAEAELANIANAKPDTWGDMSDSFQAWAQNRARHALAAMKGTP